MVGFVGLVFRFAAVGVGVGFAVAGGVVGEGLLWFEIWRGRDAHATGGRDARAPLGLGVGGGDDLAGGIISEEVGGVVGGDSGGAAVALVVVAGFAGEDGAVGGLVGDGGAHGSSQK